MSLLNWNGMNQVCVVGSRSVELATSARLIFHLLQSVPEETIIATRGTRGADHLVEAYCDALERKHIKYRNDAYSSPWMRDTEMVEHSDAVIALFNPDQVMDGGTGHVVREAIRMNKPAIAFTYNAFGTPILVGSWEVPGSAAFDFSESLADLDAAARGDAAAGSSLA